MSLTEYSQYTSASTNLYAKTTTASVNLRSIQKDEFAICVTDAIGKNVWFIEVLDSSANNETVTVTGPCIHLVFDNNACPSADTWVAFFDTWDGETVTGGSRSFGDVVRSMSLGAPFRHLSKCEILGSFNGNKPGRGITLNGVFKNNTIDPSDDNTIKAMGSASSAKVGAFVTYLTTLNSVYSFIPASVSFLHGADDELYMGALSGTPLTNIKGE